MVDKPLNQIIEADFIQYREERLTQVKPSSFNHEINIIYHEFKIDEK